MSSSLATIDDFDWSPQPNITDLVHRAIDDFCDQCEFASWFAWSVRHEAGSRIIDWVDHLSLREFPEAKAKLVEMGFELESRDGNTIAKHPRVIVPTLIVDPNLIPHIAIKVESVVDFLAATQQHRRFAVQLKSYPRMDGNPGSRFRCAVLNPGDDPEFWAVERHGFRGFVLNEADPTNVTTIHRHFESLLLRKRSYSDDSAGFEHATDLVNASICDLGVDHTCDFFFAAERQYWQSRNRAAQIQKRRQDKLGLGWANHDHHTYRSSREHFTRLISILEVLGFKCRERFYGGREAGWGAQVLEQPNCGIVIFADVDLTPDEVTGDFAHQGLPPRDQLGTVGLWCKLHGEAFLQAGLHHLECQFDFDAAREQLALEGIKTMTPFTDFPYLKQAFTEGENWPVELERIEAAQRDGFISRDEAERFRQSGSIGSHLEILERNGGYKGFNQTGISEIIRDTDPRRQ